MQTPKTRPAVQLLMIAFIALPGQVRATEPQEPYFPPMIFSPRDEDLNSITNDMLSDELKSIKEPSLWKSSQANRTATIYRFLWLAPGLRSICVRLTQSDGAFTLHVATHDGAPGFAEKQAFDKEMKLGAQQGEQAIACLQKAGFWTSPVKVKESRGIADGDMLVIEGAKEGKYHIIVRAGLTTGELHKESCRSLLELADVPASLKEWDRRREEERKMPDYVPEPPQTEDTGDI